MKIANNRALVAEKKTYEIPSVEMTQMTMSSIVMAGSSNGLPKTDDPIPSGEGGD